MPIKSNATSKPQKQIVNLIAKHLEETYGESELEIMEVNVQMSKGAINLTIDDDEPLDFPNAVALGEYLNKEYPLEDENEEGGEEDESDDTPEDEQDDAPDNDDDEDSDEESEDDDFQRWSENFRIQCNEFGLDPDTLDDDQVIAAWESGETPKKAAKTFASGTKQPKEKKKAKKELSDKEKLAKEAEAKRRAEEKAQKEAEEKRRTEIVNNLTNQASEQISKIVDAVNRQSRGEIAVNEARLRKGEIFYNIKQLGQQLKNNGDNSLATGAKINKFINDTVGREFAKAGMQQTPIIRKEISTMTQAYEVYCKDFGGVDDSTFKLLFFRDQVARQIVQYDTDNALVKPVGVIDLDKLLAVKAYHNPSNRDILLSFLANFPRKTVLSVAKLFDAKKDNVEEVILKIVNATKFEDDDSEVNLDTDDIEEFVAERLGVKPTKTTKNITVGLSIWNDLFVPISNLATQVIQHYERPTFLDEKSGVIKNDIIIGGILEYFNPTAGKSAGVLEVLVSQGVITQDESALFLTALESGELNKAKEETK